jgi:predicted nuclease with TOPRIM domain
MSAATAASGERSDEAKVKLAALHDTLQVVQHDRAALRAQIASSISLLSYLKDELVSNAAEEPAPTDDLVANANQLEERIAALKAEIEKSRRVHAQLSQQTAQLISDLAANHAPQSSSAAGTFVSEIIHRIDDINSCFSTLYDLHASLQAQTGPSNPDPAQLEAKLQSVTGDIANLEASRAQAAAQLEESQARANQASSQQASHNEAVAAAVATARVPIDKEHAQRVEELRSRIAQQQAKRESLIKEIDNLRSEANVWTSRLETVTHAKTDASNTAASLKEELDRIKQQHEQELQQLNTTLASAQMPMSSYLAAVQPIRTSIAETKAQHDNQVKALATIQKNNARMQQQIKTIESVAAAAPAAAPVATPAAAPQPTPVAAAPAPVSSSTPAAAAEKPAATTVTFDVVDIPASTAPSKKSNASKKRSARKAAAAPAPLPVGHTPAASSKPAPVPVVAAPAVVPQPVISAATEKVEDADLDEDGFKLVPKSRASKVEDRSEGFTPLEATGDARSNRLRVLQEDEDSDDDEQPEDGSEPAEVGPGRSAGSQKTATKKKSKKSKTTSVRKVRSTEKPAAPSATVRATSSTTASPITSAFSDLLKPIYSIARKSKTKTGVIPHLPPSAKISAKTRSQSAFWKNPPFVALVFVSLLIFVWFYIN